MGVSPVPGYGFITQQNAAEIYRDKETYDQLDTAQKHLIDRYVPPEQREEIDYDTGANLDNAHEDGWNQIKDADAAESHGGQGGNVAASTAGSAAAAAGFILFAPMVEATVSETTPMSTICWTALAGGAISAAAGAAALASAKLFDNGYNDRVTAKDNADGTNGVIDANTAAMEDTMELMNEDMDLYQEMNDLLTDGMNEKAAQGADLKQQLADCEAVGDKNGAKRIKEQLKQMEKDDEFEGDKEDLDGVRENLEMYREANVEATGVSDGAKTVSDFLGQGTTLGVFASINALILGVTTTIATINGGTALLSGVLPWEKPVAIAANILFMISVPLLAAGTATMASKAVKEFECGSAGSEMDGHIEQLDNMKGEQESYIEETNENFDESDETAQEDREEGQKAADDVAPGGTKNPNGTNKSGGQFLSMTGGNGGDNGGSSGGSGGSGGSGSGSNNT